MLEAHKATMPKQPTKFFLSIGLYKIITNDFYVIYII